MIKQVNLRQIFTRDLLYFNKYFKNYPLGWGYDGSIKATKNYLQYLKDKKSSGNIIYEYRLIGLYGMLI